MSGYFIIRYKGNPSWRQTPTKNHELRWPFASRSMLRAFCPKAYATRPFGGRNGQDTEAVEPKRGSVA